MGKYQIEFNKKFDFINQDEISNDKQKYDQTDGSVINEKRILEKVNENSFTITNPDVYTETKQIPKSTIVWDSNKQEWYIDNKLAINSTLNFESDTITDEDLNSSLSNFRIKKLNEGGRTKRKSRRRNHNKKKTIRHRRRSVHRRNK